jgi:hypothetical protein
MFDLKPIFRHLSVRSLSKKECWEIYPISMNKTKCLLNQFLPTVIYFKPILSCFSINNLSETTVGIFLCLLFISKPSHILIK